MTFVSYTEKLSFYAACFLLISTIIFVSIPGFKSIVIGYLSILWSLFILHRLFFIIAPQSWRENINKKLSVRLSKTVDVTPQKLKSAIIWRLSQWDVIGFSVLFILAGIFLYHSGFILSPDKGSVLLLSDVASKNIQQSINPYYLGMFISVFTIYLSILFSFFSFFRSFLSKLSFKSLYFVIIVLFIAKNVYFSSFSLNLMIFSMLLVVSLPMAWCFVKILLDKRYSRFNSMMVLLTLIILLLNISNTNISILGDVITFLCLPIIGFFWASARQTPFDSAPKTSFELTMKAS